MMGKPKADCNPDAVAKGARGKFVSVMRSLIHSGWPLAQIRPGSPTPKTKVRCRLASSNSVGFCAEVRHEASHVSTFASRSRTQDCPNSQPKLSQIALNNIGAAA